MIPVGEFAVWIVGLLFAACAFGALTRRMVRAVEERREQERYRHMWLWRDRAQQPRRD